jgi:hypothetical protein
MVDLSCKSLTLSFIITWVLFLVILGIQFLQAKNSLGETFGTKKIKQQIKSVERNAVNVNTLEGVSGILRSSISAKTSALPSKGTRNYAWRDRVLQMGVRFNCKD